MATAIHRTDEGWTVLPAPLDIQVHTDAEWNAHRDAIKQKYIDENETTRAVQHYMEEHHGYKASIKQYERRFKKWGMRKNRTKEDFISIDQELKRKRLTVDDADVTFGDHVLSRKRLKKAISRHIPPSLLEKWHNGSNMTGTITSLEVNRIATWEPDTSRNVAIRPSLREGKTLAGADTLPWFEMADSLAQQLLSSTQSPRAFSFDVSDGPLDTSLAQKSHGTSLAKRTRLANELLATMSSALTGRTPAQNLMALEAFFVERRRGDLRGSVSTLGKATDESLVIILSYALYLFSNNLASHSSRESFLTMFQAAEAQTFAKALSSSSLLSARAVVSQLLVAASVSFNVELLEQLHGYGVDLNMPLPSFWGSLTAMQITLNVGLGGRCTLFVQLLLEFGADPNLCQRHPGVGAFCERHQHGMNTAATCCCCDYLPMNLAARISLELVETMLEYGALVCICFKLTSAVEKGVDADYVQRLLSICPKLVHQESIGAHYLSPLQAAIGCGSADVADVLLDNGADVGTSYMVLLNERLSDLLDESPDFVLVYDFRSPLALALKHNHSELAAQILERGADSNLCYLDLLDDIQELEWGLPPQKWLFNHKDVVLNEEIMKGAFTPLQAAVVSGSASNVQLIIDAGAELTCKFGFQPLVLAAMARDIEIVKMLLEAGAPVDDSAMWGPFSYRHMTALAYASANGSVPIMKMLIDAGADINHCDAVYGLTPLQAAVAFEAPHQCVELLLASHEVDVWHAGSSHSGANAIVIAFINNDHIIVDRLISHIGGTLGRWNTETGLAVYLDTRCHANFPEPVSPNADIPAAESYCSMAARSAMMLSQLLYLENQLQALRAIPWHGSIAKDIFEAAVDARKTKLAAEVLQYDIQIPLEISTRCLDSLLNDVSNSYMSDLAEMPDLIRVVLASQASRWGDARGAGLVGSALWAYYHCKNSPNAQKRDPINLSALSDVIKALVSYGIDVNSSTDYQPAVPLQLVVHNNDLANISYWIDHGAALDEYGCVKQKTYLEEPATLAMTPLQRAAYLGNVDIVEILLGHGADLNYPPSADGHSALGAACDQIKLNVVRKLIAAKVDVNAFANFKGESSLAIAARTGSQDIVLELIHSGANVDMAASEEDRSRTPLQAACEAGHIDIVTVLINNNADVNAAAGPAFGATALQAAAIEGYFKICQMLIGCGAKVSAPASPYEGRTAIDGAAEMGRLDIVKFLLDKYDGDENIADVCGRARWFPRKRGHMIVDELLATYKQFAPGRNPVLPPRLDGECSSDSDEEESISDTEEESISDTEEESISDTEEESMSGTEGVGLSDLDDNFFDYGTDGDSRERL